MRAYKEVRRGYVYISESVQGNSIVIGSIAVKGLRS